MRFSKATDPQTKEKFAVLSCAACGLGETHPLPESLDKYYAEYYGGRHGWTNNFCAWRRVRWLETNYVSKGRLLDVGCGDGTFLKTARRKGWDVCGTELDAIRFDDSEFEIFGSLREVQAKYGAKSFDAVTMWHTLEHFKNPREALENVSELLADEGVLLIAVPDACGWQARVFGRHWLHLDVPRHLFHFGFDSLETLLVQCGFSVKSSWHQEFEYDLLGWSQSGLNKLFNEPNVFFKTLSGHQVKVNPFIKTINFALGVSFSAIALPLVWLGTICKKGGTLIVSARKKSSAGK
jgi:SAM-dependent methyltransferase